MAASSLTNGIATLYDNEKFSDVIIRCGNSQWYAHRNVLWMQSAFFAKACEQNSKDGAECIIDLDGDDDEPEIVEAVLKFMYKGEYTDLPEDQDSNCLALNHIRISEGADKYCVFGLAEAAAVKFRTLAYKNWATDGFIEAIFQAFWKTQIRLIRATIIEVVLDHVEDMFNPEDTISRFRDAIKELPEFASELAQALGEDFVVERNMATYYCPSV